MVYFDSSEAGLTIGLTVRRGLVRIGADKGGQSAGALKPFAVSGLWQSLRPPLLKPSGRHPPFHGENRGSNPLGRTNYSWEL